MSKFYLIILTALIITSCGINKSITHEDLYETKWSLKTISGLSEFENSTFRSAGLVFSRSNYSYSGSNGCNMIQGKFTITDDVALFSEGISSKRACKGIDEQKFHILLQKTNRIKIVKGVLSLYEGNKKLAEFDHREQ